VFIGFVVFIVFFEFKFLNPQFVMVFAVNNFSSPWLGPGMQCLVCIARTYK